MRICLFEQRPETLQPLSWTRPVFELLCGFSTLGDKQRRHFGNSNDWGMLTRPTLANLQRLRHPGVPCNDEAWLRADRLILVNGRWLPPSSQAAPMGEPCVALVDGQIAYIVVSARQVKPLTPDNYPIFLAQWRNSLPIHRAGGRMIDYPWQLVEHNGAMIAQDFSARPGDSPPPASLQIVGPRERCWVDPSAQVDPLVVADTTRGPVVIAAGAVLKAFTRLEGPCAIGQGSHILGAKIGGGATVGVHCRVGGEVESSILHGHVNKHHEGFLGHSYLGEWVNLGAGTHTSDLRNDYGEVSVTIAGQTMATGLKKVGSFLGDHVKTGIGALINTGTNVGVFSTILPAGRYAPKYVPSFMNWWKGELREGFPIEHLLETARQAMKRRGQFLTSEHVVLFRGLFEQTALERRRILAEAPLAKPKRKSA